MPSNTHGRLDGPEDVNQEESVLSPSYEHHANTRDYPTTGVAGPSEQIIDLLREIRASQVKHDEIAATKDDISKHAQSIIDSLSQQNESLRDCIARLKSHIDLFSVRTITTVLSLVLVAFSSVLLLVTVFRGPIEVAPPLPHLLLILSVGLYFMARHLPGRST